MKDHSKTLPTPVSSTGRKAIGVLVSYVGGYMYGIVEGVRQIAAQDDVDVIVYSMMSSYREASNRLGDKDTESLQEALSLVQNSDLFGLVINTDVADFVDKSQLIKFMEENPHLAYVSISTQVGDASLIVTDNYKGMRSAVEHLIDTHSKTRIAFIGGPADNLEAQERFRAYQDVLVERGIGVDEDLCVEASWFIEDGEKAARELLEQRKVDFEAIVGANDNLAMGALNVLKDHDLIVPEDVLVVGFDNSIFAVNYSLTSVNQSVMDFGRLAAKEIIDSQKTGIPIPKILLAETTLVRRLSCGCQNRPAPGQELVRKKEDPGIPLTEKMDEYQDVWISNLKHNSEDELYLAELIKSIKAILLSTNKNFEYYRSTYLGLLNHIILQQNGMHEDIYRWQTLFLTLNREMLALDPVGQELIRLNSIFYETNLLIAEELARVDGSKGIEFDTIFYNTVILGQRIMACDEEDEMGRIYLQALKLLRIQNGYFSVYQQPVEDSRMLDTVQYVCGMVNGKEVHVFNEKRQVSFSGLDPRLRLDIHVNKNWLVLPLGIGGLYYGHIVFEMHFDPTQWTQYRSLQIYMAQGLKNIHGIKMLRQSRLAATLANTAKGEFLSRMTHELRTPMNGVIGMTSLLMESDLTKDQMEIVSTIKSSGNALIDIIGDLLDFSKIEAGKVEIEYVDVDIRPTIEECIGAVSAQAAEKKINLCYFINRFHDTWAQIDIVHFRQVLANLLSNAIKFTLQGEVKILVDIVDQNGGQRELCVSVIDSGIGIPEQKRSTLFQPFSQADVDIHRKFGGTGLGLAISQNLCELMGGRLRLEKSSDQGSCFSFSIQAKKSLMESSKLLSISSLAESKLRLTAVFSENKTNLRILDHYLENWKIQSHHYLTESSLLEKLKSGSYDFLVVEKHLKESEFKEFLRSLRREYPTLPIIVYISLSEKIDAYTSINSVLVVYKPVRPKLLLNALEQIANPNLPNTYERPKSQFTKLAEDFPLSILLAEDNLVNQKVAVGMLKKCGYQVDIANHGQQAVDMAREKEYDLIFMDIFMPVMDGMEATKQIRKLSSDHQPNIVALTANANRGDKEMLLEQGMDGYLSKPLQVNSLVALLEEVIQERNE